MPKTWGLTFKNDSGKILHGSAADNYLVYNKCHGLPAYTPMVIGGTLFAVGTISAGYNKLNHYLQSKAIINNDNETTDE